MAGPYPLTTLGPTITAAGITIPAYSDIVNSLVASMQSIYGSDIYLGNDSLDYQFLAAIAQAISDSNQNIVAAYNSYAPSYAQGASLSAEVKINGMRRNVASNSIVNLTLTGVVGTVITNGVVQDINNNLWNLPASVVIGSGGIASATATAQQAGKISAAIGNVNSIYTPVVGWQSVTNPTAATTGQPVETDYALRQRQALAVAGPATALVQSILGAIAAVPNIGRLFIYENATGTTNSLGIPAHSVAAVVEGGSATAIAQAIASRKPPGIQTYGTTAISVTDSMGATSTINFYALVDVAVYGFLNLSTLGGYLSTTAGYIQDALAQYCNSQPGGTTSLNFFKLYGPANLQGDAATLATGLTQAALDVLSATYTITNLYVARADMVSTGGPYGAGTTTINFSNAANYSNGASMMMLLDNGVQWPVTVTGVTGSAVTFTPAIPTSRSVPNGTFGYLAGNLAFGINEVPSSAAANFLHNP